MGTNGDDIEREVLPSDTFLSLKQHLREEGLCPAPPEGIHFSYGGQPLDVDTDTFAGHSIETGAAFYVLQLDGMHVTWLLPWREWNEENWQTESVEVEVWACETLDGMKARLLSNVEERSPEDLQSMIWFVQQPGEVALQRLPVQDNPPDTVEPVLEAPTVGQTLKAGCRIVCEWPRRELTAAPGQTVMSLRGWPALRNNMACAAAERWLGSLTHQLAMFERADGVPPPCCCSLWQICGCFILRILSIATAILRAVDAGTRSLIQLGSFCSHSPAASCVPCHAVAMNCGNVPNQWETCTVCCTACNQLCGLFRSR